MTRLRTLGGCFGPEIGHDNSYHISDSDWPAGWTIDTGVVARPDSGAAWLKQDGSNLVNPSIIMDNIQGGSLPTDNFGWFVFYYRHETAIAEGDIFSVINMSVGLSALHLRGVGNTGGGSFSVGLRNDSITGTEIAAENTDVTFANNINYVFLIQVNNVTDEILVWEAGAFDVPILQVVFDSILSGWGLGATPDGSTNGKSMIRRWRSIHYYYGATEDGRPGFDPWTRGQFPVGNVSGEDAWGDEDDCGAASTAGDFTNWDDYISVGVPDEAVFNCKTTDSAEKQMSTLTDVDPGSRTVMGGRLATWSRANLDVKTVNMKARLKEGSNVIETGIFNMPTNVYGQFCTIFDEPPGQTLQDGSLTDWPDPDLLELGYEDGGFNNANCEVAAIGFELAAISDGATARIPQHMANIETLRRPAIEVVASGMTAAAHQE